MHKSIINYNLLITSLTFKIFKRLVWILVQFNHGVTFVTFIFYFGELGLVLTWQDFIFVHSYVNVAEWTLDGNICGHFDGEPLFETNIVEKVLARWYAND